MTLSSEIIAVRELKAGERVGYGRAFRADKQMRIGTVACGYADGYPRHAPTGTPILVNGQRTHTLGRVSMDMLSVDMSEIADADIGTPVTLWGEGLACDEGRLVGGGHGELRIAVARLRRECRFWKFDSSDFSAKKKSLKKQKTAYVCTDCGATALQWFGACPSCGAAGTLTETIAEQRGTVKRLGPRRARHGVAQRGRDARAGSACPPASASSIGCWAAAWWRARWC